jgi:hypothetical protein
MVRARLTTSSQASAIVRAGLAMVAKALLGNMALMLLGMTLKASNVWRAALGERLMGSGET